MLDQVTILAVDDEPLQINLIQRHLASLEIPFVLESTNSGKSAIELTSTNPEKYDLILLDRNMPEIDGLEVLKSIRQQTVFKSVPIILQTARTDKEDIIEGMQAGAYYYLTKPFNKSQLLSVVNSALVERLKYRQLKESLSLRDNSIKLLDFARFKFKTLEDTKSLAVLVANLCPEPDEVAKGLAELLINAVEHGNLGISYDEKSNLQRDGLWSKEIASRLLDPKYCHRFAELEIARSESCIEFLITDQGDGFDWNPYMDFSAERMLDSHGRGIAMANKMCFSSISYQGKGNIVRAIVEFEL